MPLPSSYEILKTQNNAHSFLNTQIHVNDQNTCIAISVIYLIGDKQNEVASNQ